MSKKELFVKAHKMTKELKLQYKEIDYRLQLGLCIKYLLNEEKLNKEIGFTEFFRHYEENQKLYNYLFFKQDILSKNGFETKNEDELYRQDEITTSTYKINNDEIEDIKQTAILKVIEYFQKYKTLKYRYITNLYTTCVYNSCKSLNRQKRYFKINKNPNFPLQKMETDCHFGNEYKEVELDIIVNQLFDERRKEIFELLKQGYNKVEISQILKVSRQTVHKSTNKIGSEFIKNGIVYNLQ